MFTIFVIGVLQVFLLSLVYCKYFCYYWCTASVFVIIGVLKVLLLLFVYFILCTTVLLCTALLFLVDCSSIVGELQFYCWCTAVLLCTAGAPVGRGYGCCRQGHRQQDSEHHQGTVQAVNYTHHSTQVYHSIEHYQGTVQAVNYTHHSTQVYHSIERYQGTVQAVNYTHQSTQVYQSIEHYQGTVQAVNYTNHNAQVYHSIQQSCRNPEIGFLSGYGSLFFFQAAQAPYIF